MLQPAKFQCYLGLKEPHATNPQPPMCGGTNCEQLSIDFSFNERVQTLRVPFFIHHCPLEQLKVKWLAQGHSDGSWNSNTQFSNFTSTLVKLTTTLTLPASYWTYTGPIVYVPDVILIHTMLYLSSGPKCLPCVYSGDWCSEPLHQHPAPEITGPQSTATGSTAALGQRPLQVTLGRMAVLPCMLPKPPIALPMKDQACAYALAAGG